MDKIIEFDPLEKAVIYAIIKEIQQEIKDHPEYFTVIIGWKLHLYIRMNYNNNPFKISITVSSKQDVSYSFLSSCKR